MQRCGRLQEPRPRPGWTVRLALSSRQGWRRPPQNTDENHQILQSIVTRETLKKRQCSSRHAVHGTVPQDTQAPAGVFRRLRHAQLHALHQMLQILQILQARSSIPHTWSRLQWHSKPERLQLYLKAERLQWHPGCCLLRSQELHQSSRGGQVTFPSGAQSYLIDIARWKSPAPRAT